MVNSKEISNASVFLGKNKIMSKYFVGGRDVYGLPTQVAVTCWKQQFDGKTLGPRLSSDTMKKKRSGGIILVFHP